MAGGIDWFRWHHGTVTDQKFPLIAKRAGASVAEAVAVWACLLEAASMNEKERGLLDAAPDFEAMDCALGMADGRAHSIFVAMCDRGLLDESLQVTAWPRRQPKRERDDDSSTARVQAFRDRQRNETPRNANDSAETPRGEESREELTPEANASVVAVKPPRASKKCPASFVVTAELQAFAAGKHPMVDWMAETEKFRDYTFRNAISDWPGAWRNWIRKADENRPALRSSLTHKERDTANVTARVAEMTGGLVSAKPATRRNDALQEVFDAAPRLVG